MEYGVKEDIKCILGTKDNPGRMVARAITAIVTCRGGKSRRLRLVTDRFDLPARIILEIYRLRWSIEVLFRLLKRGGFDLEKPPSKIASRGSSPHTPGNISVPAGSAGVNNMWCGIRHKTPFSTILQIMA